VAGAHRIVERGGSAFHSSLEACDQAVDVVRVEADGASEVNGAELAASDQPLHGARMDVEEICRLVRRQKRRVEDRCRAGRRLGRGVGLRARGAFRRFVSRSRGLSYGAAWRAGPLVRSIGELEERELTFMNGHRERVSYPLRAR
jgi:hypothetical protein